MSNEEDKALLEKYGVTYETKIIYCYKQNRYDNLTDALRYAQIDSTRSGEPPAN